ncbi:MAG: hypothetical protein ACRD2Y_15150 [Terriglobales bacterium]
MTPRSTLCAVLFAALLSAAVSQEKPAEPPAAPKPPVIPDTYTNLQVLPKDIKKPDLLSVMKSFSITMEVRCMHCHAVPDDLSSGDFASDEKPTKLAARKMLAAIVEVQKKYAAAPPAQ